MVNLINESLKIGLVGRSGSGKTTFGDVLVEALGCARWSAGGEMRDRKNNEAIRAKESNVDLDVRIYEVTTSDDVFVDTIANNKLLDKTFTGVIDGRTTLLLARRLIGDGLLNDSDYFNITFETSLFAKGTWGLPKYQKKPGMEKAAVDDVMKFLSDRDLADFERYFELYSFSHGLEKVSDLYQPVVDRGVAITPDLVRGITLYPEYMQPADELITTLAVLFNLKLITSDGLLEARDRGLRKVKEKGFPISPIYMSKLSADL